MSTQLYEEALADVKRVKEVAEDDAKRAIIEAVTPRIRDLIERELLREVHEDEDVNDNSVTDEEEVLNDSTSSSEVSEVVATDEQYELTSEAARAIESLVADSSITEKLDRTVAKFERFNQAGAQLRQTEAFKVHISQMISEVENIYEYVQGSMVDSDVKGVYELRLETLNQNLNQLQESISMSKKTHRINEEDVTLKLTNLPDDLDLDAVGVDLITGDEDGEEGGDELVDFDGMGDEEGADDLDTEIDGLDDEVETQLESDGMSDDTVVEIEESEIVAEIARFKKKLKENGTGATAPAVLDDFGGGSSEGDPLLDQEVCTESDDFGDEEPVEEQTASMTISTRADKMENLKRKLALETRMLLRAQNRAAKIKEEMQVARSKRDIKTEGALRVQLAGATNRINESKARIDSFKGEASKAQTLSEARTNRASAPADTKVRKQLAEANLRNQKLVYANKLLQNENLSTKQKAQIIEKLDGTKNEREAKLVYESLTNTLASRTSKEGRQQIGSSSRPTRSGGSQLVTESANTGGFDMDRWSKMAGITK